MNLFSLFGTISIDSTSAQQSIQNVNTGGRNLSKTLENVGKKMADVGKKMTTYVTAPIVAVGVGLGKAAMDLEATGAKYDTVFAGMTEKSDAFIAKFKELTPATNAEARSMASGLQDLLVPMGFMRDEATNMTGEMMHVVGALTNFNSGTHTAQDVTNAMQSALLGSYQSLASLGIQLDVNTVKQKAVEQGLAKTTDEVTKQHMSQVMIKEVYAQSGDALDAYTEANLDATTKMGLAKAEIIDLAAQMGVHLLPIINKAIDIIRDLSARFGNLSEEQQKIILIVGAVVAAIGPLLIIVGKVITLVSTLTPLFTALGGVIAFLVSPIGLAILAITALIAIGVLLYKNWDEIKYKFNQATDWIADILGKFAESFGRVWSGIWEGAKNTFTGIIEGIKSGFAGGLNWILGKINDFASKANSLLGAVNKIPGVNIPQIPSIPLMKVDGSHANGLANVPFDGYIAELHKGERVLTAQENKVGLGNIYVTITGNTIMSDREMDRLGKMFVGRLRTLGVTT